MKLFLLLSSQARSLGLAQAASALEKQQLAVGVGREPNLEETGANLNSKLFVTSFAFVVVHYGKH